MAVYTLPGGGTRINVSRGGSTFTKNSSGFIIRQRRKPLLKRTEKVTRQRVIFRNVVSNYRLMTSGQKTSWASKTPQFQRVNSLGNTYELLGNQLFQGLNQNRVRGNETINNIAPDAAVFPSRFMSADGFFITPFAVTVFLNITPVPPDFNYIFWSSKISTSNKSLSFPSDYKFLKSFPPDLSPNFILTTAYLEAYGSKPIVEPGLPKWWFIQIILEAEYIPSGEKSVLSTYTASIFQ